MSGDLISRKDAISALKALEESAPTAQHVSAIFDCEDTIRALPSAELGRKKGHWVKVGGYFTPGGDPVWKCSECGKGMHVYGIEAISYNSNYADGQWVACPNCGADMTEE